MGQRRQGRRAGEILRALRDKNTLLLYSFMYGPNWDNPCLSCTSLVDGFDRTCFQVSRDAAFVTVAKASARTDQRVGEATWMVADPARLGIRVAYQADYQCQGESDDMQLPVMHVFMRRDGRISHFWGTELKGNHVDTVWPYWNLMDFTPGGGRTFPFRRKRSGPDSLKSTS